MRFLPTRSSSSVTILHSFFNRLARIFEVPQITQGQRLAPAQTCPIRKRTVYILRNVKDPQRYFTGLTSDVGARLLAHNQGRYAHTASGGTWIVDIVIEFADERRAIAFERYLKSGSGVAFAKRNLR